MRRLRCRPETLSVYVSTPKCQPLAFKGARESLSTRTIQSMDSMDATGSYWGASQWRRYEVTVHLATAAVIPFIRPLRN
jgi:hypothetical protein